MGFGRTGRAAAVTLGMMLFGCSSKPGAQTPGTHDGADGGGTDGGQVVAAAPPVLLTASGQGAGRLGKDLRIGITGSDANGDLAALEIRLLNASGGPVLAFDSDRSGGPPDSATSTLRFDVAPGAETIFDTSATVEGLYGSTPGIAQVAVKLVDRAGQFSAEKIVPVSTQPVRATGEFCDSARVLDRCIAGDGCRGSPAQCVDGVAPAITRIVYQEFRDPASTTTPKALLSTRVLIEGTDLDEDVSILRLSFFDASNTPVAVALGSAEDGKVTTFDLQSGIVSAGGKFFVEFKSLGADFGTAVTKITAVPIDLKPRSGPAMSATRAAATARSTGQTCDPRGFDVCAAGAVCQPNAAGTASTCVTVASARTQVCAASPLVQVSAGTSSSITGLGKVSLWDPPAGCLGIDATGTPEGTVRLRLAKALTKLTLTTDRPGTTFDTVLYAFAACGDASKVALGCADDGATTSASTLVVNNVPAGDYLVVVDALGGTTSGSFELGVTAE